MKTNITVLAGLPRLLSMPDLTKETSASRASIYSWIREGSFPKPIRIGRRRVAWLAEDIEKWIAARRQAA